MTEPQPSPNRRSRTFMVPLIVAVPLFYLIFAIMQGWTLLTVVETYWDAGQGNVWIALQIARGWVWLYAVLAAVTGFCWAWIILKPLKRYKQQLERFAEEGRIGPLETDPSELSFMAVAINRALEGFERTLPDQVKTTLQALSSGVVLVDPEGRIKTANAYVGRIIQASEEGIEGAAIDKVLRGQPEILRRLKKALETRQDFPQEQISITDRFGEQRNLSIRTSWVRSRDNKPVALVLTLQDLSRLELFTSGVNSAAKLGLLAKITAGITHEVRNPLASIRGLAQLLAENQPLPAEKVPSYARIILEDVDRVTHVLDRLALIVSQPDRQKTPFSLRHLLDSVQDMVAHLARRKRVQLEVEMHSVEQEIFGIPNLLIQAVLNIVVNAIEAVPEGSWVRIRTEQVDQSVQLLVENPGPPISPGDLDDIFQPFHSTKEHAAGLGLTITETIVHDHGGELEVSSGENKTCFRVILPLTPTDNTSNDFSGAAPQP